jgi:transmembrane sensor
MAQERLWILFSKNLSGEATPAEQEELQDLLQKHPEWQLALQNTEEFWMDKPAVDSSHAEDAYMLHMLRMGDTGQHNPAFDKPVRKNRVRRWLRVCAVFLVGVSLLFLLPGYFSKRKDKKLLSAVNEVSTKPGSKSTVKLPDGSVVVLNAGSHLTYTKDFGKEIREVKLEGEAFFDVAKMADKPFIINTKAISIKVLGTVFNVKAYPEDKKTETSLIHGSVEVMIHNRPNDKIILSPNEKLVVDNNPAVDQTISSIKKKSDLPRPASTVVAINKLQFNAADSTIEEVQWTRNRLVFREETLADILTRMERWYGVEISLEKTKINAKKISATFEGETIYEALDALRETVSFQYEVSGNRIIIN